MPEITARTASLGLRFNPLRRAARAQAREYDLPLLRDDAEGLVLESYYGRIAFLSRGEGVEVALHAPHAEYLQVLKDALVAQLGAAAPGVADAIRWSDAPPEGRLPANAALMRVLGVAPLAGGFLRITLQGDVTRFTDAAIHFRLGLPPEGRAARWPTVAPNGATKWPEGADRLHLPVYTARTVDPARGQLCFDLFEHAGGRATQWARTAQPGQEVLVMAPGGGGCLISGELRGFADETAFPAIARILEANPDATGRITLYTDAAGAAYPLPDHSWLQIDYAEPERREDMGRDAKAAIAEEQDIFLWFAGERELATSVRSAWRALGRRPKDAYVSAFWQKT
ncbi:siderophore-interacting protein [Salipiger bermudensis]|uniref:siderophore-interacting protein n=1 Tax=Salipiger bermudensis TaxID=344736 RepID=UPI001CD475EE|nr:siderophore-interacting protein [Salipiger bermudensis]MCA0964748.1 siderophore-interacting protein [Salipiger bermudensis]